MKESDLHREWARVLNMCEGTKVSPKDCWKMGGVMYCGFSPTLTNDPNLYEFAVAIIEDKPVFVGDVIYRKSGSEYIIPDSVSVRLGLLDWNEYSWKKTFMPNGEELPCPDESSEYELVIVGFEDNRYHFTNKSDIVEVEAAINKLLQK